MPVKFRSENNMLEPSILQAVFKWFLPTNLGDIWANLQSLVSYSQLTYHLQFSGSSERDPQCGSYYDKVPLIFIKIERVGRGAVHISWCQVRARNRILTTIQKEWRGQRQLKDTWSTKKLTYLRSQLHSCLSDFSAYRLLVSRKCYLSRNSI